MFNWRVLRNETMRKEEDEVELKVSSRTSLDQVFELHVKLYCLTSTHMIESYPRTPSQLHSIAKHMHQTHVIVAGCGTHPPQ